ncbi:MAG: tetratricopeptide repeat protein [Spirochaetaceae bacterium]|jgi:tetratricopeptide (TPR) repeat protein|nr:tetratricopeptide repeat protein [Spirochaetaceae bacterium]
MSQDIQGDAPLNTLAAGIGRAKAGDLDGAVADFSGLIAENSRDADALNNLAIVYRRKGLCQDALGSILDAIECNPGKAEYQYTLGKIYRDLGNFKSAAMAFARAVESDSALIPAYVNLGAMHILLREWDKAERFLRMGLSAAPDNPVLRAAHEAAVSAKAAGPPDGALPFEITEEDDLFTGGDSGAPAPEEAPGEAAGLLAGADSGVSAPDETAGEAAGLLAGVDGGVLAPDGAAGEAAGLLAGVDGGALAPGEAAGEAESLLTGVDGGASAPEEAAGEAAGLLAGVDSGAPAPDETAGEVEGLLAGADGGVLAPDGAPGEAAGLLADADGGVPAPDGAPGEAEGLLAGVDGGAPAPDGAPGEAAGLLVDADDGAPAPNEAASSEAPSGLLSLEKVRGLFRFFRYLVTFMPPQAARFVTGDENGGGIEGIIEALENISSWEDLAGDGAVRAGDAPAENPAPDDAGNGGDGFDDGPVKSAAGVNTGVISQGVYDDHLDAPDPGGGKTAALTDQGGFSGDTGPETGNAPDSEAGSPPDGGGTDGPDGTFSRLVGVLRYLEQLADHLPHAEDRIKMSSQVDSIVRMLDETGSGAAAP